MLMKQGYEDMLDALWAALPTVSEDAFMEYWKAIEYTYRKLEALNNGQEN